MNRDQLKLSFERDLLVMLSAAIGFSEAKDLRIYWRHDYAQDQILPLVEFRDSFVKVKPLPCFTPQFADYMQFLSDVTRELLDKR